MRSEERQETITPPSGFAESFPSADDPVWQAIREPHLTFKGVRWSESGNGSPPAGARRLTGPSRVSVPQTPSSDTPSVEDYQLLEQIGLGGMGQVWLAVQSNLNRLVAVKCIRPDRIDDRGEQAVQEFRQEALLTAQLDHPNIAPVLDLGQSRDGEPLLAMKYVQGTAWPGMLRHDRIAMKREAYLAKHLPILVAVAQAVAFAHSRGIAHRDIKPAQVVVGNYGEVTLMDWGLAVCFDLKRLPQRPEAPRLKDLPTPETASGYGGTPTYMAPEQMCETAAGVGPHTDVFLLGATLFEIVSGITPRSDVSSADFPVWVVQGRHHGIVNEAVWTGVPEPLRRLACHAMMPNPKDRVASAAAFVKALQDYLGGVDRQREAAALRLQAAALLAETRELDYADLRRAEALLTKSREHWAEDQTVPPLLEAAQVRHCRLAIRHGDLKLAAMDLARLPESEIREELSAEFSKATARARLLERIRSVAIGTVICLLVAVAVIQQFYGTQLHKRTLQAERAERKATDAGFRMEQELHRSSIRLASGLLATSLERARETLLTVPAEFRDIEWGILYHRASPELSRMNPGVGSLWRVDAAPNGDLVVAATESATNVITIKSEVRALPLTVPSRVAEFSPDGTRLLIIGTDLSAQVLEQQAGGRQIPTPGFERAKWVEGCWENDGTSVVALDDRGSLFRIPVGSGERNLLSESVGYLHSRIAVAPNTGNIAVSSEDYTVRLFDPSGRLLGKCIGHAGGIHSMAFNSRGDQLVAGCSDATFRVWDANSAKQILNVQASTEMGERGGIAGAVFLPGDDTLATASMDGSVVIWDLTGAEVRRLSGLGRRVYSIAVQPERGLLVTVGEDQLVHRWALLDTPPTPLRGHSARSYVRNISVDGGRAATFGHDNTFRLWDLDRGEEVLRLHPPEGGYSFCEGRLTADGSLVALTTRENVIRVFSTASGSEKVAHRVAYDIDDIAISPNGALVVAGGENGGLTVLRVADGVALDVPDPPTMNVSCIAFSNSGRYFAVGSRECTIRIYDSESRALVSTLAAGQRWPEMVEFSLDEQLLAAAGFDSVLRLYLIPEGQLLREFRGHTSSVSDARFTNDQSRLITASHDGTLRVWDAQEGTELATIEGGGGPIDSIALAETGRLVLTFRGKDSEVWETDHPPLATTDFQAWQDKRLTSYMENWTAPKTAHRARIAHFAQSPEEPSEAALNLLLSDLRTAYPNRTFTAPANGIREWLRELAGSLPTNSRAAPMHSPATAETLATLETTFGSVVRAPLVPRTLSLNDERTRRSLRILVRTSTPSPNGEQVFIAGNRPELGEWKANLVALKLLSSDGDAKIWGLEGVATSKEFKFTWARQGAPWGESHEWPGTPNRLIDQSTILYEDADGKLYYLATFGVPNER